MGSEDRSLKVHSKKIRWDYHHPKGKHSHQNKSRRSQLKCFTYDEIGHYAINCPKNKSSSHKKKGNMTRHHAHVVEDDEPSTKRNKKIVMKNML